MPTITYYAKLDGEPKRSTMKESIDVTTDGISNATRKGSTVMIRKYKSTEVSLFESSRHLSRHWTLARENNWIQTTFLLLADVVGTGVLGLPYAFKRLGWIPGIAAMVIFYFAGQYTGKILCKLIVAFPEAATLGELAEHLFNRVGIMVSYVFLYVYLFFILCQYLLVSGKAVQGALYNDPICIDIAILYVACVLLPLNQVRTLHSVSFLSIISTITILVVLVLSLLQIITDGPVSGSKTELVAAESVWDVFAGCSTIIFAFAGHKIYVEMMYEMHTPADFKKSINFSYPFLLVVYAAVACIGYYFQGDQTKEYLIDVIPIGVEKAIASAFMFLHISISYVLNAQVLCRAIHCRVSKDTVDALSYDTKHRMYGCLKGQSIWFVISGTIMCLGFVVANSISFFSSFVELLGSLFDPWFAFGAPALLFLIFNKTNGKMFIILKVFLYFCVLTWFLMMILGASSAILDMLKLWDTYASPWSCLSDEQVSG